MVTNFRFERYTQASSFANPKFFHMETADYSLAFESVLSVELSKLSTKQISAVASSVHRVITMVAQKQSSVLTQHLVMLLRLSRFPTPEMFIIQGKDSESWMLQEARYEAHRTFLLNAVQSNERDDLDDVTSECAQVMAQLSRSVLG